MSIGIASTPALVRALFLAILIASIHGCDSGAATSQAADAAGTASQTQEPNARHRSDPKRNRVWSLTPEGVSVHDVTAPESIDVPLPGWQWVDAQYACLPDLALGPDGEAVITSNIVPTLWRIDPSTLAVSVHPLVLDADTDKDVGFSALVYSSRHAAFFAVSDVHASLWRIDPLLRNAQKISLSTPLPRACALAVQPRLAHQGTSRQPDLCMRGPEGSRSIRLARDQRSASVTTASCTVP